MTGRCAEEPLLGCKGNYRRSDAELGNGDISLSGKSCVLRPATENAHHPRYRTKAGCLEIAGVLEDLVVFGITRVLTGDRLRSFVTVRPSMDLVHVVVESNSFNHGSSKPIFSGVLPGEHEIAGSRTLAFNEEHMMALQNAAG